VTHLLLSKELITRYKKGEKEAKDEFVRVSRKIIYPIVIIFTEDSTKADDLMQDILLKCLQYIEKCKEEIQYPDALVKEIARNHCIQECSRKSSRKTLEFAPPIANDSKGTSLIEILKDSNAIPPGSKEYYKLPEEELLSSNLDYEYKRNIPDAIRKKVEMSLEYINLFYILRKQIKSDLANKYQRILDVFNILEDTKGKITYILGPVSWNKIGRYKGLKRIAQEELTDSQREELMKLKRQSFKIEVHKYLEEMLEMVSVMFFHSPLFNEMALLKDSSYGLHEYFGFRLSYLSSVLPTIKIKPPRLMFMVWAKGLRRGKYADQKKIKLIFRYFKRKTKGTDKEYLFDSVDEYVSTFDAIRKSRYKKSTHDKFYKKLANYIYKNSFIYTKEEK